MHIVKSIHSALIFAILTAILTLTACGVPGGKSLDHDVQNAAVYHQSNDGCQTVNVSETNFSPASLRSLMACLNGNGQIPELNSLVQSSRDEELAPVTEFLNRALLTRPSRLYQIEHTLQLLEARGVLQDNFEQLSHILSNGDFVTNAIHVLNHGYFSTAGGIMDYVTNGFSPAPNEKLLSALEELGKEITNDGVAQALDYGLTVADARVTQSLQNHFRSPQNAASHRSLSDITHPLLQFLESGSRPGRVDLGKQVLTLLSQGPLWNALDRILPETDGTVARVAPQWSQLINTLYRDNGRFFRDAPELFSALSDTAQHPIACMRGASRLSNLTPPRVLAELDRVTLKEFLASLIVARPFCEFPRPILEGAASFMPIATSEASDTLETWVRAFNTNERLVTFMVDLLGERDSFIGHLPGMVAQGSRLRHLAPLMDELNQRGALNDVMLLAALIKVADRPGLSETLGHLVESRPSLNGASIYDNVAAILPRIDEADINKLIVSMQPYIDHNEKIAAPFIASVRSAFYANDVHPGIDLLKETLTNAKQNKEFFTALFKIVGRNGVQFARVVAEVANLARRDDGRLKDITFSFFRVFHHYSERSPSPITEAQAPAFVPRSRHNLIGSELQAPPTRRARPNAYQACNTYDFNFSLAEYSDPNFSQSFNNLTQCLAFHEEDADIERSLNFVANPHLLAGSLQGRSLLSWTVDLVRGFAGAGAAVSELTERFLAAVRDHRINAPMEAFPHWVKRTTGTTVADGDSILDPLLRLLGRTVAPETTAPVVESAEASYRRRLGLLRGKTASVCTFQRADADEDGEMQEGEGNFSCESFPVEQAIRSQLAIWEPQANPDARLQEIMDEFLLAVEHDFTDNAHRASQNNRLQTSWDEALLLEKISKVYTHLVNPKEANEDPQNLNQHKVLEGLLAFPQSINAAMNPYHHDATSVSLSGNREGTLTMADFFARWMVEQANTLVVFPYYYHGALEPKVRITSNLDRLGLVLENSDAVAIGNAEPVLAGLDVATSAWSDEPLQDRPESVRNETSSRTLATMVKVFESGLPDTGNCLTPREKPVAQYTEVERTCVGRINNLKGWVMPGQAENEENLREQPSVATVFRSFLTANSECHQPTDCFGLKLIRNLFTGIRRQTPEAYRSLFTQDGFVGQKSNLKVMQFLAKTGVFRYGTKLLFGQDPQDPVIRHLFRSLVLIGQSAQFPLLENFLKTLVDPSERGPWSLSQPLASRGLVRRTVDLLFDLNRQNNGALGPVALYGSAAMSSLQILESPTDVTGPVLKVLTGAVNTNGGRSILSENVAAARALLGSEYTATLLRTLYKDSVANPASNSQWNQFRQRYIGLQNDPTYPKVEVARLLASIIDFLHHPPRAGEAGNALYQQALTTLLQQVAQGQTEELVKLLAHNPEEVYGLLSTLARFERQGHAKELVDMVGRLMEPVPAAQR